MSKSFSDSVEVVGFLEECALYLDERGLDMTELDVITSLSKSANFFTYEKGVYEKHNLQGWAYRIHNKYGEPMEGSYLLRPCNWPDRVFTRRKEDDKDVYSLLSKVPKFYSIGDWSINWVSTAAECKAAPAIMLHEKFTCAYLSVKHLNIPSIGMSGCYNWSKGGRMLPELRDVLVNMPLNATVYMCLDGDIEFNPLVQHSASSFKGYMESMRPDITVVFPKVPKDFGGWDDWAVQQDDIAACWLQELHAQKVDISGFLPTGLLIDHYGLAYKVNKDGDPVITHTTQNYTKLISGHPKWDDYIINIDDQMYDVNNPRMPMESSDLARKVEIWLTGHVFHGAESEKVRAVSIEKAVKETMDLPARQQSLPHHHIRALRGAVGRQAAYIAAQRMVTEGIKVVGPMTQEETVETMLRVFRDMVGMWSFDWNFAPQWFLALVGPSNAGKSDFIRSALRSMTDKGFLSGVSKVHYTGDKAKPEEMARILKSSLVGVVDEYNPPAPIAKMFEDQLLSLSSDRLIVLRKMRENTAKPHLRNASLFLTTTDKNRQYLRSGKGEGAERRAITLEVVPHYEYEGKLSSNRQVIKECGEILLRWGLEAYEDGYPGSATEFSVQYAEQYLAEDDTLRNVAKVWVRADLGEVLERAGRQIYRPGTSDWRFSPSILYGLLYPDTKVDRVVAQSLQNTAIECGAVDIGKCRIFHPHNGGPADDRKKETQVDRAYAVADWPEWCAALRAKLGV